MIKLKQITNVLLVDKANSKGKNETVQNSFHCGPEPSAQTNSKVYCRDPSDDGNRMKHAHSRINPNRHRTQKTKQNEERGKQDRMNPMGT